MTGMDFLRGAPVPFKFSKTILLCGELEKNYEEVTLDTGDIVRSRT